MAWEAYLSVGAPCGMSEDGMATWWDSRLASVQN